MSYLALAGHRSMVFDAVRTRAYADALKQAVGPASVVLDLGAGTGLFGLIAARLGARRVYLVEPEDVLDVAAEIVRANGLERVVECVPGRAEEVRLPEPADLIISVFTGNLLFSEDLLPSLFHARDHALAPGGLLVPSAARVEVVPVSAAEVHAREVAVWSSPPFPDVDMSAARAYAANAMIFRSEGLRDATWLAEPQTLCTLDFYREQYAGLHADATYEVTASGVCHGWLGWFSINLGGHWLSSSPREPAVHWTPVLMPLDPPMAFERGQRVTFSLHRAPFADWFWSVKLDSVTQSHSTLLATPLSAATLRRARPGYVPTLTGRGRAIRDLLTACNGTATVESLARELLVSSSGQFADVGEAVEFVRSIVKNYA